MIKKTITLLALVAFLISCFESDPISADHTRADQLASLILEDVGANRLDQTTVITGVFTGAVLGSTYGFLGDTVEIVTFYNGHEYLRIGDIMVIKLFYDSNKRVYE